MESSAHHSVDSHIIPGFIHKHTTHVPCADVAPLFERLPLDWPWQYHIRLLLHMVST